MATTTTRYTSNLYANGTLVNVPMVANSVNIYRVKGNGVDYFHKFNDTTYTANISLTCGNGYGFFSGNYDRGEGEQKHGCRIESHGIQMSASGDISSFSVESATVSCTLTLYNSGNYYTSTSSSATTRDTNNLNVASSSQATGSWVSYTQGSYNITATVNYSVSFTASIRWSDGTTTTETGTVTASVNLGDPTNHTSSYSLNRSWTFNQSAGSKTHVVTSQEY